MACARGVRSGPVGLDWTGLDWYLAGRVARSLLCQFLPPLLRPQLGRIKRPFVVVVLSRLSLLGFLLMKKEAMRSKRGFRCDGCKAKRSACGVNLEPFRFPDGEPRDA